MAVKPRVTVMWDDLVVLGVAVVVIPIVVVFGLFRLAGLKRAENFPPMFLNGKRKT